MIKLIASDMDGTLLNNNHKISEKNLQAIKAAQEAGLTFMIATGRGYRSVKDLLDKNGIKCSCILMNGSEIRDEDGNVLTQIQLSKEKIRKVVDILAPYNIVINFMTATGSAVINTKEEITNDWVERLSYHSPNLTVEERENIIKKFHLLEDKIYINGLEELLSSDMVINKIEAFYGDSQEVLKINETLRQIEGLAVASATETSIEVTDIKAQKGIILEEYIKQIGLKKEEVIVFGDSFNDESLFDLFPYSFATANAMDGIKEKAYRVIESNHDDGVGKTILELLEKQKTEIVD